MSRRGNKEGSIFKRKDGRWCAAASLNGKRIYLYGKTRAEVAAKLKETLAQIDNGLTIHGAKYTMNEYLNEWLKAINGKIRASTLECYRVSIRVHIVPHIGQIRLKDLRPDHIQALYNIKAARVGPSTIRIMHAILHKSLGQAIKLGLIGRNPADGVTRPPEVKRTMGVLTPEQAQMLLSHLAGDRDEALYYLALTTGLRRGELIGLQWDDLDWLTGDLMIQRQLIRINGVGLTFTSPKTDAGRRMITIGEGAIAKLRAHFEMQQVERQFAGRLWKEHNLIFCNLNGNPMDPPKLSTRHRMLVKKLGLPPIRFHDLRHTAATLMLKQRIHPKIVQARLGHSSITITLDRYSHVLPQMQEEVAKRMDEILTPIPVEISDVENE